MGLKEKDDSPLMNLDWIGLDWIYSVISKHGNTNN